jgi:hypothetical protein
VLHSTALAQRLSLKLQANVVFKTSALTWLMLLLPLLRCWMLFKISVSTWVST